MSIYRLNNTVVLDGSVDVFTLQKLYNLMAEIYNTLNGCSGVTLDFEKVTYLDSAGLGCLVQCAGLFKPKYTFEIINANDKISHVIKVSNLHEVVGLKEKE